MELCEVKMIEYHNINLFQCPVFNARITVRTCKARKEAYKKRSAERRKNKFVFSMRMGTVPVNLQDLKKCVMCKVNLEA